MKAWLNYLTYKEIFRIKRTESTKIICNVNDMLLLIYKNILKIAFWNRKEEND